MKKLPIIITCSTLLLSSNVYAFDWLDSLKSFVGLDEEKAQTTEQQVSEKKEEAGLNISSLISSVTSSLGSNEEQSEGAVASLFSFAKTQLPQGDFSELAKNIPGVDGILSKIPDVSSLTKKEGLGGLLDKASEYSDSLKTINTLKNQFEALGIKPEMITQYISSISSYLDTEQGQQAKALFQKGLSAFTSQ